MTEQQYSKKDFDSGLDVRWCPGCGDYAILAQIQQVLATLDHKKEDYVFISGIGCSSRFPYYMDTYGMHSIHGRAPAVATGFRLAQQNKSTWLVTGDGDGLSIGGNHLLHILRRNVDATIMLFDNRIYGLTKGQYSPTSDTGTVTKSSPYGSIDNPVEPVSFALGAGASYVARTSDRDLPHLRETLAAADAHRGTSFVHILQNCIVFNDKVWENFTDKKIKSDYVVYLEDGQALTYGKDSDKSIVVTEGYNLRSTDDAEGTPLVHDSTSKSKALMLASLGRDYGPMPMGLIYQEDRPIYEQELIAQEQAVIDKKGRASLDELYHSGDTWVIE